MHAHASQCISNAPGMHWTNSGDLLITFPLTPVRSHGSVIHSPLGVQSPSMHSNVSQCIPNASAMHWDCFPRPGPEPPASPTALREPDRERDGVARSESQDGVLGQHNRGRSAAGPFVRRGGVNYFLRGHGVRGLGLNYTGFSG